MAIQGWAAGAQPAAEPRPALALSTTADQAHGDGYSLRLFLGCLHLNQYCHPRTSTRHVKSIPHIMAIWDGSYTLYQSKHHHLHCLHSLDLLLYGKESYKGTQREGTWLELACFPRAAQNCTETDFWEACGTLKESTLMARHTHLCQARTGKSTSTSPLASHQNKKYHPPERKVCTHRPA